VPFRPALFAIPLLLLGAGMATLSASSVAEGSNLADLVSDADWIAEVETINKRFELSDDGSIQTVFTFSAITPMKGSVASIDEVRIPGGVAAGRGLHIPGMPRIEVGDHHILFLSKESVVQRWRLPVRLSAGAFRVRQARPGAGRTVVRALADQQEPEIQDYQAFRTQVLHEIASQRSR